MTTKELVQVAQWIDEGVCEYTDTEGKSWRSYPSSKYREAVIATSETFSKYRRKPAQPKLRPWRPEEVPVGALLAWDHTAKEATYLICTAFIDSVIFIKGNAEVQKYTLQYLTDSKASYSLDHGKTWLPCGILE